MRTTPNKQDVERLRELGGRVAEIAALPEQAIHRKIWTAVNDGKMTTPAVLARDYPAYLLNVDDALTPVSADPFLRAIEADLLLRLYEWEHMRCHRVVEPVVRCQAAITDSGFGIEASSIDADELLFVEASVTATAKHFNRVLCGEEDLEMIRFPEISHDEKETQRRLELLNGIFAGILEVKLYGIDYFHCVPWDDLLSWMGIEEGMYDFALNPEFMHKAIQRHIDASIYRARQYEALGLVSSNNTNSLVGAGGYGYTSLLPKPTASGVGVALKDIWGDAADQIMTSVSPEMSLEFAFEYEKRWADLFGYMYYGCCERLDHKLDGLRTMGNIRKVSMSPYAVLEEGMERMGKDLVVSFKPNSNYLAMDRADMEYLRREVVNVCNLARKYGCSVEIVMKTIITLRGEPQRLWQWCDMATEVVADY